MDGVNARPGGRSARIRRSVLDATIGALLENGYDGLGFRDIAATADVSEATLYRRWGNITNLVADAVGEFALDENPIPDTGVLETDLRHLLHSVVTLVERPDVQRLLRGVMALSSDDGTVVAARRAFWHSRFERGAAIVRRAIERGEIPGDVDPGEVIEMLVGASYTRALLTERRTDERMLERSVHAALAMCDAPGL
ncbi:TetR/AcrR family transcriptional regulator [Pseudoclavibacter chungangensis]|uniref:TetR/AcrR family transcriptional regulator n=1 Tax=Pseudoclavibacter chungangensis TaxID=587635 RepID=A0A7J5BRC1_9MICO|nr:TetR/AcrR family transcriptional regulator [Pseudoclavibacter chungangensis]KAB1656842.1 TetR/AcrR family transcriptional regulator [Pseudoclavibacter chungangensis]NYJ67303.1 AcrR family transcriptional regulator [Pseudoclavibacter chungangensis]